MPEQIVGPLTYINVRGQDQATAIANLDAAGILYEIAANGVYSTEYTQGEIAVQEPDPDVTTEIAVDDVVSLTLSLGEEPLLTAGLGSGLIQITKRKRRRNRKRRKVRKARVQ